MGDRGTVERALEGVTDVVILAGLVGDPITKAFPTAAGRINDDALRTCIDAIDGKGVNKAIFVSTCSNYGIIGEGETATEAFPLKPLSLLCEVEGGRGAAYPLARGCRRLCPDDPALCHGVRPGATDPLRLDGERIHARALSRQRTGGVRRAHVAPLLPRPGFRPADRTRPRFSGCGRPLHGLQRRRRREQPHKARHRRSHTGTAAKAPHSPLRQQR